MREHIWYLSLCSYFISLNIMPLSSSNIAADDKITFFSINEQHSFEFIH